MKKLLVKWVLHLLYSHEGDLGDDVEGFWELDEII